MIDPEALVGLGLWGLFVSALLAGSILPFASEVVLAGVLALGAPPGLAVVVATAGNVLGALSVYAIGRLVSGGRRLDDRLLQRFVESDPTKLERAHRQLERWGSVVLVLAWLPVVGDVLVLAAGLARLELFKVTLFTTLGKAARYVFVTLAMQTLS